MKLLVFITGLTLFLSAPSHADRPQITLLTSVTETQIENELLQEFRSSVKNTPFQINAIRDANQFDLWKELHNPANVAVIWLSHAGQPSHLPGFDNETRILDEDGIDLAPVFTDAHPGLKYLGVVGCHAEEFFKQRNHYRIGQIPDLTIFSFAEAIEAKAGLQAALVAAFQSLQAVDVNRWKKGPPFLGKRSLTLERTIPADAEPTFLRPTRIDANGETLAIFPKGAPGKTQKIKVPFPFSLKQSESQYITATLGYQPKDASRANVILGNFKISEKGYQWDLRKNQTTGLPIGISQNIYSLSSENK